MGMLTALASEHIAISGQDLHCGTRSKWLRLDCLVSVCGDAGWGASGVQDSPAGLAAERAGLHQAWSRCSSWHTVPLLQPGYIMQQV